MAPRALSEGEIVAFRGRLCRVAARHFAERGYAGVTMRDLAAALGCSPMTPYRYFRNKEHIFAAVRAAALARFADRIGAAAAAAGAAPLARIEAIGRAYVAHACEQPDAFRIMFQLEEPDPDAHPELTRETTRAWQPLREAVADAVVAGRLLGDADTLAHLCWLSVHGLVTLHLAGRLRMGRDLESLVEPTLENVLAGARVPRAGAAGMGARTAHGGARA